MFDLDCCVAFVTNIAAKTLSDCLNNRLLLLNVTKSQWIAMYFINRAGSISQKELAKLMGATQPTTTGILDRLEREGLVKRTEDEFDKRKKVIILTEKGKDINRDLTDIAQEFRDKCLEGINEKDQEIFMEILDKMVISAKAWDKETKQIS